MGAAEIARNIRQKVFSPVEVVRAFQERAALLNPEINAVVTWNDQAIKQAEQLTSMAQKGQLLGPLHGVPFTVKDAYDTAGVRTTYGSLIYENNTPRYDATVARRLKEAGAILLGKTNLPEFCLGVETENRIFGRTLNPWDLRRTPGGSSGGEAAAISAGLSPLGVGSDQGGSLRLPAHYCGVFGFKPTIGRIPITGHRPDTLHQFATAGLMARYAEDLRVALSATCGADGADWYADVPIGEGERVTPVERLRVGYVVGEAFGPLIPDVSRAAQEAAFCLKGLVASVAEVTDEQFPNVDCDLLSEGLYRAEGAPSLAEMIVGKEELLYPWIKAELGRATKGLREYLEGMAQVQRLRWKMEQLFQSYDILICPVAPITAPVCGFDHITVNGEERRLRSVNRALQPFNLSGNPAASVPYCLASDGVPIGVQVVGGKFRELDVLAVAERIELARPMGRKLLEPGFVNSTV
jgi:aspartyl-tRNA(Asn)/glutamyl-tRNA(Gln) amidotransferase subunit A